MCFYVSEVDSVSHPLPVCQQVSSYSSVGNSRIDTMQKLSAEHAVSHEGDIQILFWMWQQGRNDFASLKQGHHFRLGVGAGCLDGPSANQVFLLLVKLGAWTKTAYPPLLFVELPSVATIQPDSCHRHHWNALHARGCQTVPIPGSAS